MLVHTRVHTHMPIAHVCTHVLQTLAVLRKWAPDSPGDLSQIPEQSALVLSRTPSPTALHTGVSGAGRVGCWEEPPALSGHASHVWPILPALPQAQTAGSTT